MRSDGDDFHKLLLLRTSLSEGTNPTDEQINVKLTKMCYVHKVNSQVILSTNTKLWWIEKNKTKQKGLLFLGCC